MSERDGEVEAAMGSALAAQVAVITLAKLLADNKLIAKSVFSERLEGILSNLADDHDAMINSIKRDLTWMMKTLKEDQ